MNEQQWDEFLDKLDFAHLSGRWELLPLHWLEEELPEAVSELGVALVSNLLQARTLEDKEERLTRVRESAEEYRSTLSQSTLKLDSRLCPPGSRVTLRYLDPQNLGEGDCLITTGAWDRLGYLVAELAHPGEEHVEQVGETPVRREPGELSYRSLLLFPDKGTPSPRAFRALCEKALRQARTLGGRHFALTHLHLPQSGLADRFAAAEVVSAVRQMLREGPGTTVDILVFTHRNFEDYRHWFKSLQELAKGAQKESSGGYEGEPRSAGEPSSEVVDSFKSLARRSTELATEATASVTRWLKSASSEEAPKSGMTWREPNFEERRVLAQLYLGRSAGTPRESPEPDDGLACYLHTLSQVVTLENEEGEGSAGLLQDWRAVMPKLVGAAPSWGRYFQLLEWRLARVIGEESSFSPERLSQWAETWSDRAMKAFLQGVEQDSPEPETNLTRPPVTPGGSRLEAEGSENE